MRGMKTMAATAVMGVALVGAGPLAAQGYDHGEKSNTIVDVAVEAGSFGTLVTAVKAAGLVDVLSGEGPFTVFAPTDAAFAKLPAGTLQSLLDNPDALRAVLTYHVLPGRVMASDVLAAEQVRPMTVQGEALNVRVSGSSVMVNDARVTATDVEASNGVIHVIDTVVLPPSMRASRD